MKFLVVASVLVMAACADAPLPSDELGMERQELVGGPVSVWIDPASPGVDLPAPATTALPGDARAFVVVYGYQGSGLFNLPRESHTWATFVQAVGDDLETAELGGFTISWLPEDGTIGLGQGIEPGRNYGLVETLDIARDEGFEVRRSRIFEIEPALFEAARARKAVLDSGTASYRMIDSVLGRQRILAGQPGFTNCIHAVSDTLVYSNGALLDTGIKHGYAASNAVFGHLAWFFVDQTEWHDVLVDRLAL